MVTLNITVLVVAIIVIQIVLLATKQWVPSLIISMIAFAWAGVSFTMQKRSPPKIPTVIASPVAMSLSPAATSPSPAATSPSVKQSTAMVPSYIYGQTVTGKATERTRGSPLTKNEPDQFGRGYTVKLPPGAEVPSAITKQSSGERLALTHKRPQRNARVKRFLRQVKWNPNARHSLGELSNVPLDDLNNIASQFVDTDHPTHGDSSSDVAMSPMQERIFRKL